ncbi:MAG: M3 family metallopeptidase, partial [Pseudomonadota bacterium]
AGHAFRDAIKTQLEASDLVIVIWTEASVRSHWVIAEAQYGFERSALLPLIHPDVAPADIPMPFGTLHTVSTADLDGLLRQIAARNGPVTLPKAAKAASAMGAFFKPSERPLPSEPQGWDLSALYNDPSEIEPDLVRLDELCKVFAATFRGRLSHLSGPEMLACLVAYGKIEETAGRVMSYLGLRTYSDTRDGEMYQLMRETQARVGAVTEPIVFFSLEMAQLTQAQIAALIIEAPDLKQYRAYLKLMAALAPHQLPEAEELALHRDSEQRERLVQDFDNRMGTLQVELSYPSYPDETLGLEHALNRLTDPVAEVRKAALDGLSAALEAQGEALFDISRQLILSKAREDKARGLLRPDAGRLFAEQSQPEWIDAMMSTVAGGYARTTHRYYPLKANWLGETRLAFHDRNAPLPTTGPSFTYGEAVRIVHETFDSLSPRLGQLVHKFFTSRWVDARPVPHRSPGAFAHPTVCSAHPFVHAQFYGGSRDVMTLGGMLGHGVLQVLAQNNGPLLGRYPLSFSNAIASFFETLVTEHMMLRAPDDMRPFLTAGLLEERLNAIERQAMFFRFEQKIHRLIASDTDVTVADVNALWISEQKAFMGPGVDVTEAAGWLWSYIPHFVQSPFTTGTYTFGGLLASVMYAAYLEEREAHSSRFIDRLIAAMEAGSTVSFSETLEILEIDPAAPETWRAGVDVSAAIIDTLEGVTF